MNARQLIVAAQLLAVALVVAGVVAAWVVGLTGALFTHA